MASKEHNVSFSLSLSIDNSFVRDSHNASSRLISRPNLDSFELLEDDMAAVVRFDAAELDDGDVDDEGNEATIPAVALAPVLMLSRAATDAGSTFDEVDFTTTCDDDNDDDGG